jgi:hypothetical protein
MNCYFWTAILEMCLAIQAQFSGAKESHDAQQTTKGGHTAPFLMYENIKNSLNCLKYFKEFYYFCTYTKQHRDDRTAS